MAIVVKCSCPKLFGSYWMMFPVRSIRLSESGMFRAMANIRVCLSMHLGL